MIKFEDVKHITAEEYFKGNQFAAHTFNDKYTQIINGVRETPAMVFERVASQVASEETTPIAKQYWASRWFEEMYKSVWMPGGSILQGAGNERKISLANCCTVGLKEDTMESIFEAAYKIAKYAAYREGVGIDFSNLRPAGAKVNNSACNSTGVVPWTKFIDSIGDYVGQSGRKPAMLVSLKVDHPDVLDFIAMKSNQNSVQNANVSIQITDEFMRKCTEKGDPDWELKFTVKDTGEVISKTVKAKALLRLLSERACNFAEPAVQFIDMMQHWQNTTYVQDSETGEYLKPVSSNACLSYDTLIKTRYGTFPIESLVGKTVEIWDGNNWLFVDNFRVTNTNQNMLKITFYDGSSMRVTPYHNCVLNDGTVIRAEELREGMRLKASDSPLSDTSTNVSGAYIKGFLVGDGTKKSEGHRPALMLYPPKYCCQDRLIQSAEEMEQRPVYNDLNKPLGFSQEYISNKKMMRGLSPYNEELYPWVTEYKTYLPVECYNWSLDSKSNFIAGVFDADGTALDNDKGFGYQIASMHKEWLLNLQQLLKTIGVYSKIGLMRTGGVTDFHDGYGEYVTKDCWRLTISQANSVRLSGMVKFERLPSFKDRPVKYKIKDKFAKIVKIEPDGVDDKVYCCTVNTTHQLALAHGTMWGQCSEKPLYPDSVCVLASINMGEFSTDPREYIPQLEDVGESIVRFLDNVVSREINSGKSPTKDQLRAIKLLREIGCGFTNVHGWLLKQNLAYDSDEAIEKLERFIKHYTYSCYKASEKLGEEKGNFGAFSENFLDSPFIKRMMETFTNLKFKTMRNSMVMSCAPTGSLSIILKDCISSGIEPVPGFYYWKRSRTSGQYKWYFVVPKFVRQFLNSKVEGSFSEDQDSIEDPNGDIGTAFIDRVKNVFGDEILKLFKPAHLIDPMQKVKLMGKVARWVDSSISTTYNLAETATPELVEQIYVEAWKQGVKSVAVYRDKSRQGIIEFEPPPMVEARFKKVASETRPAKIERHCSPKRPDILPCDIHKVTVKGSKWIVLVGTLDGEPFEVFAGQSEDIDIPVKFSKGLLVKKDHKYTLEIPVDDESKLSFKDIVSIFKNDEQAALTRMLSLNLRTGTHIQFICEQLKKSSGSINDFAAAVARVLSKYSKSVVKRVVKCPNCGSEELSYSGCVTCTKCGWSRCD